MSFKKKYGGFTVCGARNADYGNRGSGRLSYASVSFQNAKKVAENARKAAADAALCLRYRLEASAAKAAIAARKVAQLQVLIKAEKESGFDTASVISSFLGKDSISARGPKAVALKLPDYYLSASSKALKHVRSRKRGGAKRKPSLFKRIASLGLVGNSSSLRKRSRSFEDSSQPIATHSPFSLQEDRIFNTSSSDMDL